MSDKSAIIRSKKNSKKRSESTKKISYLLATIPQNFGSSGFRHSSQNLRPLQNLTSKLKQPVATKSKQAIIKVLPPKQSRKRASTDSSFSASATSNATPDVNELPFKSQYPGNLTKKWKIAPIGGIFNSEAPGRKSDVVKSKNMRNLIDDQKEKPGIIIQEQQEDSVKMLEQFLKKQTVYEMESLLKEYYTLTAQISTT